MVYVFDDEMVTALHNALAGQLIVPIRFDYPAINAVMVFLDALGNRRYLFIQVTMAQRRHDLTGPIASAHLHTLVTACGGVRNVGLAYFVPPRGFGSFVYQNVVGASANIAQVKLSLSGV